MTDEEFMLAKQSSYNAYNVYQSLFDTVREEQLRRDNAECDSTIALISKILPNFRVKKCDCGYDRITVNNNGITIFVYNQKQSSGEIFIEVEVKLSKSSDSVETGIKESIAELITRLQSVQSTLMD